jgi:hypothetical protein
MAAGDKLKIKKRVLKPEKAHDKNSINNYFKGGHKNQLIHYKKKHKLVLSVLAPNGRNKNYRFCD